MTLRLLVSLCFISVHFAFGQTAPEQAFAKTSRTITLADSTPPIGTTLLSRMPWFYTMDEAMRDPLSVYKLSLKNEKLTSLPPQIMGMKNLQILNLSENKISEIPEEISMLSKLEVLILSQNQIRKLPESIKEMLYLKEVYLAKNKLNQVPAWFGGLGKLRHLDLSYNPLTTYEIERLRTLLPKCKVLN